MAHEVSSKLGKLVGGALALVVACTTSEARPPGIEDHPGGIVNGGGGSDAGADADAVVSLCTEPSILDGFVPTRSFFAAPTGNDANDGTSLATAWRSLRNATNLLPGDVLEIATGTYSGGVVVKARGTAAAPILLRATDGPGTVTVEGAGSAAALTLAGVRYVAVDGLVFNGASQDNVIIAAGDDGVAADHVLLRRVTSTQAQAPDLRESIFDQPEALGPREEAQGALLLGVSGAKVLGNLFRNTATDAGLEIR